MPMGVKAFFDGLNKDTLHLVDEFYDSKCVFMDPVVHLTSSAQVKAYYRNMYINVQSIAFDFHHVITQGNQVRAGWTMRLQAKALRGGKPIIVDGVSHITYGGSEGKVIYHRDYFDMGVFVYEWLPVIGPMVRYVKSIFQKNHEPK